MADASTFGGDTAMDGAQEQPSPFGGGLSFGATDESPGAPAPEAATAVAAQPSFGSGLRDMMPGPRYKPPDPEATALDQTASTLEQRISRANQVATNPILQFFNPEGVQKARDFVPQATEQLQKIKQQQQQQVDIQRQATNFGMPKSAQNPMMTNDTIDNWLLDRYKSGDFSVANALKARGKGEWVQDFAGAAVDGAGTTLKAADSAATKLNAARDSQAAYDAARKSLTPEETQAVTALGVQNIPDKVSDWQGIVSQHGAKLAQAQQLHSQVLQKLNNMTNFDGTVSKEVQEAAQGDVRLGSSNEAAGFPVRTRSADGQTGHVAPNGSVQTEKYALSKKDGGWSAWTPEREKSLEAITASPEAKGAVNQYSIANKFRHEAMDERNYTSSAGLALLKDTLGGVGRDVAENSAAAGTVGLTKMMTQQQGGFEGWVNRAQNEIGAFKTWIDNGRKGPEPRMSADTKKGLQLVAETNYQYALDQAKGRLGGAMTYAGQGGKPLDEIALDADLKKELAGAHEAGRIDAINGYRALPSIVRGNQRIFFPQGANVTGATDPRPPVPQPSTIPPPQPGGSAPLPAAPNPASLQGTPSPGSGPAGGGPAAAPVTIAGAQVTIPLPPGASPNYVPALQRIESGGERSPWTAGTKNSSASGAFQFINSTWAADKPPGAPARAADATPEQQAAALATHTARNAQSLTAAGLPVNDTNLYVAHNLGAGGASSLLKADPNADARTVVGNAAADNNPKFFKGKPTVATVLARYSAEMEPGEPGPKKPLPGSGGVKGNLVEPDGQPSFLQRVSRTLSQGVPPGQRDQAVADVGSAAVEHAPAIASTAGAVGGAALGPAGSIAGGAAGGGAGQAFKDWMQGNEQDPAKIAKQAALGGALGIGSAARPIVAAGARVAGVGGIEAGSKALEPDALPSDIVEAGVKGGAYALGGEALGRFVSSAGATAYKALSRYTTSAQQELSASAGKLVEARKVLETEQPKLAGDAGANPKYEAAKKAEEDAVTAIKDHGQNPDDMVHAYEQAKAGVSAGEAAVTRKAVSEKRDVSAGYNELRQNVNEAGVGAPKANQALPDGPVSQIRTAENPTGAAEAKFAPDAEHAEMLAKAPAKDWGQKWEQLQNAGTELIQKRMAFLQAGDKPSADAMDAIFQGVRNQQKAAATYVFGKEKGAQVIAQLENLDMRYAKVMSATQGMSYQKMQNVLSQGNTPAARDLEQNFKAFAKDDPSAIRAFNAMKAGAKGDFKTEAALMAPIIAAEVSGIVPTLGAITAAVGGHRLYKLMQGYMNAKLLNRTVQFKDFLTQEIKSSGAASNAVTGAAQRGAVMQ